MPTSTSKAKLFKAASSFVITLLLLSLLYLATPAYSYAADDSQYFPETKHTLSGNFLEYWRANGGLPTYGYPITDAQNEVSKTDGKTYLTQWFERNRFELHPENAGTKNEMQLGLLGHELRAEARLADPDFKRTEQLLDPALPAEQQWYFEETGHNLRFRFLEYWMQNGGLARFGYPISEEHRELDQASGKVFLVQWFERARFEYHQENRPPNDVLLGLLGNDIKKPSSPVEYMWKLGKGYITPGNFSGLTVDREGYIYVADAGTGHLLKYNQSGKLVNWWDKALSGPGDVSNNLSFQAWLLSVGVAQDKRGNIYVAYTSDTQAGVRKYDRSGKLLQQIGSRGSGLGQFYNPSGLAIDKDNNLYVAEGDLHSKDEARVQKFDSTGRFLLAFGEYNAANNSGSNFSEEALLKHPAGLALDSQSNVYVLEPGGVGSSNHLIRKFGSQGNFLLSWGSLVSAEPARNDPSNKNKPAPKDGEFSTVWYLPPPVGIAIDSQDNVYVTDPVNQRIQKFDGSGNFLAKFKNQGTVQEAQYNSLSMDNQNNLYVTDFYNCLVQKYSPDGKLLLEYGSQPETQNLFDNPKNSYLDSFELDQQGNIYITGSVSDKDFIAKYNSSGQFLYRLALPDRVLLGMSTSELTNIDWQGNFYIPDPTDSTIQKFDPNGKFLFKFGGRGNGDGQFGDANSPQLVVADKAGNMYVAGFMSPYVQKFDPNGKFLLKFLGNNKSSPHSLTLDNQGNLYLTGQNGHIQKFDSQGTLLLDLGQFPEVKETVTDSQGNLYVHNTIDNHETRTRTPIIHKFDANGNEVFKKEFPAYLDSESRAMTLALDEQNNYYLFWQESDNAYNYQSFRIEKYNPDGQLLFNYSANRGQYPGEFQGYRFYLDARGYFYLTDLQGLLQKFRLR